MRYSVKRIEEVYGILENMPKPIALIDFLNGELGNEVLVAQSLGGQFYDEHKNHARVVALSWVGCGLIFENISDDQIEFADLERSMSGNQKHVAGSWHWLRRIGHMERIGNIDNVAARFGPYNVKEKAMWEHCAEGSLGWVKLTAIRLARTQFIFNPPQERLIKEPYIAVFDRNERHIPRRNTQMWQIELLHTMAKKRGFKLVVLCDFWPRHMPEGVIQFKPRHRDLDLMCNIVHHSLFYASPASGAGTVGLIFGCNFLALGHWASKYYPYLPLLTRDRGFQWLGTFDSPNSDVVGRVARFLGRFGSK